MVSHQQVNPEPGPSADARADIDPIYESSLMILAVDDRFVVKGVPSAGTLLGAVHLLQLFPLTH